MRTKGASKASKGRKASKAKQHELHLNRKSSQESIGAQKSESRMSVRCTCADAEATAAGMDAF